MWCACLVGVNLSFYLLPNWNLEVVMAFGELLVSKKTYCIIKLNCRLTFGEQENLLHNSIIALWEIKGKITIFFSNLIYVLIVTKLTKLIPKLAGWLLDVGVSIINCLIYGFFSCDLSFLLVEILFSFGWMNVWTLFELECIRY